jgi:hypothetical protein
MSDLAVSGLTIEECLTLADLNKKNNLLLRASDFMHEAAERCDKAADTAEMMERVDSAGILRERAKSYRFKAQKLYNEFQRTVRGSSREH